MRLLRNGSRPMDSTQRQWKEQTGNIKNAENFTFYPKVTLKASIDLQILHGHQFAIFKAMSSSKTLSGFILHIPTHFNDLTPSLQKLSSPFEKVFISVGGSPSLEPL
ncbi:hypothetical protein JTE90_010815 [Oedothorax gibbosus]|uniref:Uncharacterized protein n=1 Tax=Oedothorax gibbosus TaxID=931172 RepID=A0AAV6V5L4_9ARAC|nr:hypothetical protein JTE90_010815 [Oedothorax gibbosus]